MDQKHWSREEVAALYDLPFADLLYKAHSVHRQHFDPNVVQISTLLSIKTGACPEDCAYCPQSALYNTGVNVEKLMPIEKVVELAEKAKANGATRFCMGAAWRSPKAKDLAIVKEMIKRIKDLGMETCVTLGMLTPNQAQELKDVGLDFYNHNLDSSREFYSKIITTRTYDERLDTLENVRNAKLKVCCGGIIGMGETRSERIGLLLQLANLSPPPISVPINLLARLKGTPLENAKDLDPFEFIRTIAIARIMIPASFVRLSAGRTAMSDEMQAWCFFAGANSIHYGEKLLTSPNPSSDEDQLLFQRLGIKPLESQQLMNEDA